MDVSGFLCGNPYLRETKMAILVVEGVFQFAHHLQTSCVLLSLLISTVHVA